MCCLKHCRCSCRIRGGCLHFVVIQRSSGLRGCHAVSTTPATCGLVQEAEQESMPMYSFRILLTTEWQEGYMPTLTGVSASWDWQ